MALDGAARPAAGLDGPKSAQEAAELDADMIDPDDLSAEHPELAEAIKRIKAASQIDEEPSEGVPEAEPEAASYYPLSADDGLPPQFAKEGQTYRVLSRQTGRRVGTGQLCLYLWEHLEAVAAGREKAPHHLFPPEPRRWSAFSLILAFD